MVFIGINQVKNFNHFTMGFKKYLLFPVSTSLGAFVSALVILGSATAAVVLLGTGLMMNLLVGHGKRNFDVSHK
jgi:hypothetical protein